MDFFEHQERARRQTGRLVFLFGLAVAGIIAGVYLTVRLLVATEFEGPVDGPFQLWIPELFAMVSVGVVAVIAGGSLFKTFQLRGPGGVVAHRLGGHPIDPDTTDPLQRRLLNVVEEMAIASGTPVPPVFLLEGEDSINAFAAGHTPGDAVIGVTRGCMEKLSRDELQGVVAHEFSHILNGDMRLNIRLMGILHGLLLIGLTGRILLGSRPGRHGRRGRDRDGRLALLGLALMLLGYVGTFFGHLIKAAVSRQREYLADASAVQFTRLPDGISGALQKIGGLSEGSRIRDPRGSEASHMFFGEGLPHRFMSLLSTHPPLEDRVQRIDPSFEGEFPAVAPDFIAPVESDELAAVGSARMAGPAGASGPGPGVAEPGPAPGPPRPGDAGAAGEAAEAVRGAGVGAGPSLLDRIGQPGPEHLAHARALRARIPAPLLEAAHDATGARALVYALVLDEDPGVRSRQRMEVAAAEGESLAESMDALAAEAPALDRAARLPLVDTAAAALGGLDRESARRFRDTLDALVRSDGVTTLSEWALAHLASKHLEERHRKGSGRRSRYQSLRPFSTEASFLLSALAHAGHEDEAAAAQAIQAAAEGLGMELALLPRAECTPRAVEAAMEPFTHLVPEEKRRLLAACAASIAADREVTAREAELFRVVADWLDCPTPPLLPGQPLA